LKTYKIGDANSKLMPEHECRRMKDGKHEVDQVFKRMALPKESEFDFFIANKK